MPPLPDHQAAATPLVYACKVAQKRVHVAQLESELAHLTKRQVELEQQYKDRHARMMQTNAELGPLQTKFEQTVQLYREVEENYHDAKARLTQLEHSHATLLGQIRDQQIVNERVRVRLGRAETTERRLRQTGEDAFQKELDVLRAESQHQRKLLDRLKLLLKRGGPPRAGLYET